MTYDSIGRREKKRRHDDREQNQLLDSLDGDVDQRADRRGRSSGVKMGEAEWSLAQAGNVMPQVAEVMLRQYRWQDIL
jgi:hypothetical protein